MIRPPQHPCCLSSAAADRASEIDRSNVEATLTWINIRATGTGTSQDIALTEAMAIDQLFLFADGALQQPGAKYTSSGTTLTTTQPSGANLLVRYLGTTLEPPVNWIAPVISGIAQVGRVLTATTGTWTGDPVPTYAYEWLRNSTIITGATSNSYTLGAADVGASMTCDVAGVNSIAVTVVGSNAIGPVTNIPLSTPTLTNYSALGAAPLVLQWSTTDYVAGLRAQLQIATDSGFTSIAQSRVFFIDGASWALNDEAIGLATPSGTYYARIRVVRDNESGATSITDGLGNTFNADVSSWSNTFTDTINVATTQLSATNKSQYVTPSGTPRLHFLGTAGVNAAEEVFADATKAGLIRQFELTLTAWGAGNRVLIGFDDGVLTGTQNFKEPGGTAGVPGCSLTSGGGIYKNGSLTQGSPANNSYLQGDTLSCVIDQTTPTSVSARFYRTRSGTTVQIGTTVTGITGLSGGARPCVAPYQGDSGDVNFGQAAFARTLVGSEVMFG